VHRHGLRVFTQLWHCGMQDHGTFLSDNMNPVFAPPASRSRRASTASRSQAPTGT